MFCMYCGEELQPGEHACPAVLDSLPEEDQEELSGDDTISRAADHFAEALFVLIDRMRLEYRMTYAETVGVLELVKADMIVEAQEESDE